LKARKPSSSVAQPHVARADTYSYTYNLVSIMHHHMSLNHSEKIRQNAQLTSSCPSFHHNNLAPSNRLLLCKITLTSCLCPTSYRNFSPAKPPLDFRTDPRLSSSLVMTDPFQSAILLATEQKPSMSRRRGSQINWMDPPRPLH
jgi:hypothetical protein